MKPNYRELLFILIIGVLQPLFEILWGARIATYYNGIAAALVLSYVIVRIVQTKGSILHTWGFRFDNLARCLTPYFLFSVIAIVVIYAYGWYAKHTPLPVGFWYLLLAYPVWGIAQQFVLQNFIARNLSTLVPSPLVRSCLVAVIFACAHIPSLELVLLTLVVGFIFTFLYHKYPNLLALGVAHGILGALVFHLVLGQDQWNILMNYFS